MTNVVIHAEQLSKLYLIGHAPVGGRGRFRHSDGLRHQIEAWLRNPLRALRSAPEDGKNTRSVEEFWAIRDLSFEIELGEAVGIIGRNGAGKSTLLKVLSRITEPTHGRLRMRGRIASLLEVGTGFHPELTGRENIFLNGAILGMTRVEIKRKFDEIVAFAEVERFLDTPVKRYSSGMYVRLAFAVAAHLEPEILVVDEVLAVGDAEFQKKCLNKMDDVGSAGRTVLFVSHNMQAVTRLCKRSIWLDKGQIKMDGPAYAVANAYVSAGAGTSAERNWPSIERAPGDDTVRLLGVRIRSQDGKPCEQFDIREPVKIEMEYEVLQSGYVLLPHFKLTNEGGVDLFVTVDLSPEWRGRKRPAGRYVATCHIPGNTLAEGAFSVMVSILTLNPITDRVYIRDAVMFRVTDPLSELDTARGDYTLPMAGVMRPIFEWNNAYTSSGTSGETLPAPGVVAADEEDHGTTASATRTAAAATRA